MQVKMKMEKDKKFNLFFDSGCADLISRKSAILCLEKIGREHCELDGPLVLRGVGDCKTAFEHGILDTRQYMSHC